MAIVNTEAYPFRVSLEQVLSRFGGLSFYDVISNNGDTIKEAKERINDIIKDKEIKHYKDTKNPQLLFYSVLLILSVLGDRKIAGKVCRKEAELFTEDLEKEDEENLLEMAKFLGIKVEKKKTEFHVTKGKVTLNYAIHFIDYLRLTKNLRKNSNFSLSSRILKDGYVFIDRKTMLSLIKEVIYEKMINLVKPIPLSEIPDTIKDLLLLRKGITPPCISELFKKEKNNDEELKILTVYMIDTGSSSDSILTMLKNKGVQNPEDFLNHFVKDRKTRYIIYNCDKLKKMNLCVSECGVRNPLQLYFGKLANTS
ncbi:DNA primase regulatory subunit PriL [Acidianus sp. HS-5]|uniref:DNA primase regulatory subunit PriL n=1 Tax=Acidianus sp. HS-5 TaxID=2886040 RepID=UPI001F177C3D|nr:DNA primase regulatory subunit PriL [Acidianus sp. HS-5]BDC19688.1 DNA primase large subunit [Acidianus sp. HS-5]